MPRFCDSKRQRSSGSSPATASCKSGISQFAMPPKWRALAQRLGRRFEARAFITLAVTVNPDRDDLRRDLARLGRRDQPGNDPERTLAEVLAADPGRAADATTPTSVRDPSISPLQPPGL